MPDFLVLVTSVGKAFNYAFGRTIFERMEEINELLCVVIGDVRVLTMDMRN